MVDRTADLNGLWEYSTALRVARALERHQVAWLEEPFAREKDSRVWIRFANAS
jgi:L-alanine-DL-glutamate epimerase-like enolase superfamily enzyme